jgi:hypothetical protein
MHFVRGGVVIIFVNFKMTYSNFLECTIGRHGPQGATGIAGIPGRPYVLFNFLNGVFIPRCQICWNEQRIFDFHLNFSTSRIRQNNN